MPANGKHPASPDELDLVRGLRERENAAVELFLERYRQVFHHCISQFEKDSGLRDDLFQEITMAVLDRLDRENFDPEKGSFGSWVYRVAWCRCVDVKRKQTARSHVQAGRDEELPEQPDPDADPGRTASEGEMTELVRGALAELPSEERQLLELRFLQGRTLIQVAQTLDLSLETAKYRLKRASASLRKRLLQQLARSEAIE